jgi:hypothetical protein
MGVAQVGPSLSSPEILPPWQTIFSEQNVKQTMSFCIVVVLV